MLNCQQSTVGTAGFQRSLLLKAGVGFGCQFMRSTRRTYTNPPYYHPIAFPSLPRSLNPYEQSVEECATLLLRDPLDL